jgi:hypothetical protein
MPAEGEFSPPAAEETAWDKVVRFFRGLFGLDSAVQQEETPQTMPEQPGEGGPIIKPGG